MKKLYCLFLMTSKVDEMLDHHNGVSKHMTNNKNLFFSLSIIYNGEVMIGVVSTHNIESVNEIYFKTKLEMLKICLNLFCSWFEKEFD